jgi:hypothetical protein
VKRFFRTVFVLAIMFLAIVGLEYTCGINGLGIHALALFK